MLSQTEVTYTIPEYPNQVRLDTTTKCQAHCLSCHRHLSQRQGEMSIEYIDKILQDISTWKEPLHEIVPVNYGEFFMRTDWALILGMMAKKLPKTTIVLPTNGILIDDAVVDILCGISTLRIINFSINALFDETYEAFTGVEAQALRSMEKAIKKIKLLRPNIWLVASMVFDPEYQTDLERDNFYLYWKQFAFVQIIAAASAGRGKPIHSPVKLPCRSIFSDIVIGYDGKISLCCWDSRFSLDLGYYSGKVLDNWHSPQVTELRRLHNEHRRAEIKLCSECTFA